MRSSRTLPAAAASVFLACAAALDPAQAAPVIPLEFQSHVAVNFREDQNGVGFILNDRLDAVDNCVTLIVVVCDETPLRRTSSHGGMTGQAFVSGGGASSLSLSAPFVSLVPPLGDFPQIEVVTRESGRFIALTPFNAQIQAFFPLIDLRESGDGTDLQDLAYSIAITLETEDGSSSSWVTEGRIERSRIGLLSFHFDGETIPVETSGRPGTTDAGRILVEQFLLEADLGLVPQPGEFSVTVEKTLSLRTETGFGSGFGRIEDPFMLSGEGLIRGFGLDFVAAPALAVAAPSSLALLALPLALLVGARDHRPFLQRIGRLS